MVVGFVLMLSIVGIALATALYSNFLPYFSLLSDIKNYNMAYYGANTAIERSLLVLRYQEAGFEGTGGRVKGSNDSVASDQLSGKFGYYDQNTSLQWIIHGRLSQNSLPGTAMGNIDYYFLSGRTNDRNTLVYRLPQSIPLWVDNTPIASAYSEDSARLLFTGTSLSVSLQLTPDIKEKFSKTGSDGWKLDETVDNYGNGIADDVMVNWGRKGKYQNVDDNNWLDFSIVPRSLVVASSGGLDVTIQANDESVRESDINNMSTTTTTTTMGFSLYFAERANPLNNTNGATLRSSTLDTHLSISDNSSGANDLRSLSFSELLSQPDVIKDNELNLSLGNTLLSQGGNIYPFLEYKVDVGGTSKAISQPYFTVQGKSQVGKYTVQMNVKKSINKNDELGAFTVVF